MSTELWAVRGREDDPIYCSEDPNTTRHPWLILGELVRANKASGGHFFDEDTLRWFGSRNRELFRGALIELQSKAPSASLRYKVTFFDATAAPIGGVAGSTRAEVKGYAKLVADEGFVRVAAPWDKS
jgi:hypothetical protein